MTTKEEQILERIAKIMDLEKLGASLSSCGTCKSSKRCAQDHMPYECRFYHPRKDFGF